MTHPAINGDSAARFEQRGERLANRGEIVGMDVGEKRAAQQLALRVTENLPDGRVLIGDLAGLIDDDYEIRSVLDKGSKARLVGLDSLCLLFQSGQVAHGDYHDSTAPFGLARGLMMYS